MYWRLLLLCPRLRWALRGSWPFVSMVSLSNSAMNSSLAKGEYWEQGLTCDQLEVPWDGSCLFDFGGTVGLECIWLYYDEESGFAELICEKDNGGSSSTIPLPAESRRQPCLASAWRLWLC